jgi:hypothetical protein
MALSMNRARAGHVLAALAAASAAGLAHAGPPHIGFKPGFRPPPPPGGPDALPFSDNFDSYTAGTGISTNGTWSLWDPTSPDGTVDSAFRLSPPNSFLTNINSDNVQYGDVTTGRWRLRAMTYVSSASTATGTGFIIGLNTFAYPAGPYHWSMDIQWSRATGMVSCYDFAGSPETPIIMDQWVEFKAEIDVGADTYNAWYGTFQLVTNRSWSAGFSSTGGVPRIQCFDFYSQAQSDLRFDNIVFEPITSCYPDCNSDHALNVNDFVCFQAGFAASNLQVADCNHDNTLNVNDFVCFQSAFAAGCSQL